MLLTGIACESASNERRLIHPGKSTWISRTKASSRFSKNLKHGDSPASVQSDDPGQLRRDDDKCREYADDRDHATPARVSRDVTVAHRRDLQYVSTTSAEGPQLVSAVITPLPTVEICIA